MAIKSHDLEGSRYHVPALEKGLDILEYLSQVNVPQSQAELSRALGRSASELFRMLTCLEARGYLLRDEHSGKYQLSLKLYELAHTHSPVEHLLQVAREPMRQLSQTLRESCHLGAWRDNRLIILAQEESPEPIRISVEVGRKFSAIKTASGRLLLAHLSEEERRGFFARDPDYQALGAHEQVELKERLAAARRQCYVIADSDIVVGVRDISVLIGNPQIGVSAALAVPVLISRGHTRNLPEVLAALQKSAQAITRKLGLSL